MQLYQLFWSGLHGEKNKFHSTRRIKKNNNDSVEKWLHHYLNSMAFTNTKWRKWNNVLFVWVCLYLNCNVFAIVWQPFHLNLDLLYYSFLYSVFSATLLCSNFVFFHSLFIITSFSTLRFLKYNTNHWFLSAKIYHHFFVRSWKCVIYIWS